MGQKHWLTDRIWSTKYGRYVHTYNNTSGQKFQTGTIGEVTGTVFPNERESPDCVTVYGNVAKSGDFTKNDCGEGFHGTIVTYPVAANKYFSSISQANADNLALADVATNGQAYANAHGTCIADTEYFNVETSGTFQKDCSGTPGTSGTYVEYVVEAGEYSSFISQEDADEQAQDDVDANGQDYANTHGTCIVSSKRGTFLIDYYDDSAGDICFYCDTVGVTESGNPVTARVNNGGAGIARWPDDGRDPATCLLLSSDRLTLSGSVKMRFGVNMAYLISTYPGINVFTFIMRGRSTSGITSGGVYALRDVSEGYLAMVPASGEPSKFIPTVIGASTTTSSYSSHTVSGADGTTGVGVGSPILKMEYTVSTNAMVITTY